MRVFFISDRQDLIDSLICKLGERMLCCAECGYKCATRQRMVCHLEAKHLDSPGYRCQFCDKVCPTRNSYAIHKTRYHRTESLSFL